MLEAGRPNAPHKACGFGQQPVARPLERGILAATQNDPTTARDAWQQILLTHPNSAAAAAAQKNLGKLRG